MSNFHSPDEVKALLRKYRITGSKAARITGVNPRTVRSWQAPTASPSFRPIPESSWKLLLLFTGELDVDDWIAEIEAATARKL